MSRYYHLKRDLGLHKLTLRRWLADRLSFTGDMARWGAAAALLAEPRKTYTREELRVLLRLGTAPDVGRHENLSHPRAQWRAYIWYKRKLQAEKCKEILNNGRQTE